MDEILDRATLTVAKLLRQQAALAAFGTFAFRETDLQKILTEAARVCAEFAERSLLQDLPVPAE